MLPVRSSMREQRPGEWAGQHSPGGPTKNELPQFRVSKGAHHQQVDVTLPRIRFEGIANGSPLGGNFVECHLRPVASQVLAEFNARIGPVHTLFVGEGDDMNLLCRPQHGQGIGDRSRRRPAVIPGNGDPVSWLEMCREFEIVLSEADTTRVKQWRDGSTPSTGAALSRRRSPSLQGTHHFELPEPRANVTLLPR